MSGDDTGAGQLNLADFPESELIDALLDAARYGDEEDQAMISRIVDFNPALVNVADGMGRTALHMACANGHVAVVRLLLNCKTPPTKNAKNGEGSTPLHFAAVNGSKPCVEALIKAGYDIIAKNNFGRKAIDEAFDRKHTELEDLLLMKDTEVEAELKRQEARIDPSDLKDMDAPPKENQPKPKTSMPSDKKKDGEGGGGGGGSGEGPAPPTEQISMMTMD